MPQHEGGTMRDDTNTRADATVEVPYTDANGAVWRATQPEADTSQMVAAHQFNTALLKALGLDGLRHVIGLSIKCQAGHLPVVQVDTVVTQRGLLAVEALVRRTRFEMVESGEPQQAPINAEAVLADSSATPTNHRG